MSFGHFWKVNTAAAGRAFCRRKARRSACVMLRKGPLSGRPAGGRKPQLLASGYQPNPFLITRIAIAARHVVGLKSGIVRSRMNILALLTIPAIIGPLLPGDSEYTSWIPWAVGIAVGCFSGFMCGPEDGGSEVFGCASTSRRSEPQTATPGEAPAGPARAKKRITIQR